jgi:hypothetical protein
MVAICAYQHLLLVNLIQNGKAPIMPKHASAAEWLSGSKRSSYGGARENISIHVAEYQQICTAFAQGLEPLTKEIEKNAARLDFDGNLGLAKQVLVAFKRHAVRRLQRTYRTINLDDIAAETLLPDDETQTQDERRRAAVSLLHEMVESKAIGKVEIDLTSSMVRFHDEATLDADFSERLKWQTRKLQELLASHKDLDKEIAFSKEYAKSLSGRSGPVLGGTTDPMIKDFML